MHHRRHLPASLGDEFSIRHALSRGVSRGRADARDLARPFHGVRSTTVPTTFRARVECYLPRMRPEDRLVARSAVRQWGLPYPKTWRLEEPLEIACPQHRNPPRTAGVKGRRLAAGRADTWTVGGAPVVDPVSAVFSSAGELTVRQAVVLLDAVITTADNYPGRDDTPLPRVTRDDVIQRLARWGRFTGSATVRRAVEFVREGVESPKETETRMLIVDAGLPEPVVQFDVRDAEVLIARLDLAYPEWRIAVEYEGDGHRTSKSQWRRDVARQRDLEDRGWAVIRLTQQDLNAPEAFLTRIRRLIAARQAGMDGKRP